MFRRKCYCMNNSYNNSCELQKDIIEDKSNIFVFTQEGLHWFLYGGG